MAQSSANHKVSLKTRDSSALLGVYAKADVVFNQGQGAYLYDDAGNDYLDFGSGIAVGALGHTHADVVEAIRVQSLQYIHISNLYLNQPQVDLAERLLKNIPEFDKVFFCNSGTEANEAVLKFARKYWSNQGLTEKYEVISFENSFHGRTYGALSVSAQAKLSEGFGPSLPGAKWLPWNDVEALKAAIGPQTAAILLEPIQAEGGLNRPSEEFVAAINELAASGQVLLIVDEIQCSLGRLGTWLGSQSVGLKPDMVSMAKPLGGGLPLGAVLISQKIADALKPGDHGTTFGGNPVACAAGIAVLKILEKAEFKAQVARSASTLHACLEELHARFDCIQEVKGLGHLRGLKMSLSLPDFITKSRQKGLIVLRAGSDVIRLAPPLIVTENQVEEAIEILNQVLEEMRSEA